MLSVVESLSYSLYVHLFCCIVIQGWGETPIRGNLLLDFEVIRLFVYRATYDRFEPVQPIGCLF